MFSEQSSNKSAPYCLRNKGFTPTDLLTIPVSVSLASVFKKDVIIVSIGLCSSLLLQLSLSSGTSILVCSVLFAFHAIFCSFATLARDSF